MCTHVETGMAPPPKEWRLRSRRGCTAAVETSGAVRLNDAREHEIDFTEAASLVGAEPTMRPIPRAPARVSTLPDLEMPSPGASVSPSNRHRRGRRPRRTPPWISSAPPTPNRRSSKHRRGGAVRPAVPVGCPRRATRHEPDERTVLGSSSSAGPRAALERRRAAVAVPGARRKVTSLRFAFAEQGPPRGSVVRRADRKTDASRFMGWLIRRLPLKRTRRRS
jgi:hypothetical protein